MCSAIVLAGNLFLEAVVLKGLGVVVGRFGNVEKQVGGRHGYLSLARERGGGHAYLGG